MELKDQIRHDIAAHDVVLYMKGTRDVSACGFSSQLVCILDHMSIDYVTRNVLQSDDFRQAPKAIAGFVTLPFLFISRRNARGSDDIREIYNAGTLGGFFRTQNAACKKPIETLVVGNVSRAQIIPCKAASARA